MSTDINSTPNGWNFHLTSKHEFSLQNKRKEKYHKWIPLRPFWGGDEAAQKSLNVDITTSPDVSMIERAIREMAPGKATGDDSIALEHINYIGPAIDIILVKQFSNSFRTKLWKE